MSKRILVVVVSSALVSGVAMADPFKFRAIDSSASEDMWTKEAPWKLPRGYTQKIVTDETQLNIYDNGRNDWHDMNTVNETGRKAGQYMYTTHEVRGQLEGGAVTVVNLKTGDTSILAQDPTYDAVDGIRWTPWGTILFAEERTEGRLFEIVLNKDMTTGMVYDRPAVGRLAHEGIEVDEDGNVYVIDEFSGQRDGYGGGVYKFIPHTFGDLSSGDLYVLAVDDSATGDGTGQGSWVGPIDPYTARQSGTDAGGHGYNRPEDMEIIGKTLYVNITSGVYVDSDGDGSLDKQSFDGRTLAISLETLKVTNFVKPGVNVPVEIGVPGDASFQTGFDNPDNLAEAPDGSLVIVEDNVPSDIWFAKDTDGDGVADKVKLFASLSDYGAEGTGIYFSPEDPKTLYVNVQHSKKPDGDATWAISRKLSEENNEHGDD